MKYLVKQEQVSATENKKNYQLHGITERESEKKSRSGIILIIILLIVAALGGLYIYQKFTSSVDTYKTGITRLNKQVSDLRGQVEVNKEVQKILRMKDAHIINLYGSSINKEGFGKIILSFESSSGFLQVSNLPALNNDKTYQLWMATQGKTAYLDAFKFVDSIYFPISIPAQNYKGEIKFLVTEESLKDSTKPSGKVYLTGTLQ